MKDAYVRVIRMLNGWANSSTPKIRGKPREKTILDLKGLVQFGYRNTSSLRELAPEPDPFCRLRFFLAT